ncbi:MAG TPA: DUF4162 domain-containing protein, partial [Acidimicrobiales bacterium]|nr:DUF4162 domain-containing protein [Acidimicrobiales bacterium]
LNSELGMTIFLTTQYLEEADTLADRVGIISRGQLVAEGPPTVLKRTLGHDTIVVEVEGDDAGALEALRLLPRVAGVRVENGMIVVASPDGSAALNAVSVALSASAFEVKSITLRTPSLDDVFRELTGSSLDVARGAR